MSQDGLSILIINGGVKFHGQGGSLNAAVVERMRAQLTGYGHKVVVTNVDDQWDAQEEGKKLLAADSVILQFPGWWMGLPWQVKRYIDEVFMTDAVQPTDGRSRANRTHLYGSGGRFHDKTYMLSTTWNAPLEAFTEPLEFFEGKGFDAVAFPVHKAFEFLGMRAMPSFMINDIFKNPTLEADWVRLAAHLERYYAR